MKQGRSVTELGQELTRIQQEKRDYLAPANCLQVVRHWFRNEQDKPVYEPKLHGLEAHPLGANLRDLAHQQVAQYLEVPVAYYNRLKDAEYESGDGIPLWQRTVNTLLSYKGADTRLLRVLDGHVRAFLSDNYSLDLDNYDVFQAAAKVILDEDLGPKNILSCEVTERKLYLKVSSPRLMGEVNVGDTVQGGFILTNSEVGDGALQVMQFLTRLTCRNGAVIESVFKRRHVGRQLEAGEDGSSIYRDDTRQAEAKLRLLMLRDQVKEALEPLRFQMTVRSAQEAAETKLEGRLTQVIEVTRRKFGLKEDEALMVEGHLIANGDLSLWGLGNAVTQAAHAVDSYDRATELETIGGRIFTNLSREETRQLVRGERN